MAIQLSDHFTYKKLLRFTVSPMLMMLFTSIYSVVDGLFITNIVGETAFAAVNLIMPYCMIFSAFGSLFGVGGSALIALLKGQGEHDEANRVFSMLVTAMICAGVILAVAAQLLLPTAARLLGASGELEELCIQYGRIMLLTLPAFLLQFGFQTLLITAERPKLGLLFTVTAGVTNMILDWLFVAVLHWGVRGAAIATCIGQCIGGLGPLLFFLFKGKSSLRLVRPRFHGWALRRSVSNGMADFITNVAMSFVNMVFNMQLMHYLGEYGVSAYGIIMYVNFVFVAVYLGYSMGVAPVISYHYGAQDYDELKSLMRKSLLLIGSFSLVLTGAAIGAARPIASVFAGYDPEFLALGTKALRLYSLCYLLTGMNIFSSNLFAALNNGPVSAVLSGLRMLVFQLAAVLLLPLVLGSDGIWLSMAAAELGVFIVSVVMVVRFRPKYQYY